ncbi:MAG: hypothetical protein D6811_02350, partial [Alphaproteobacteria bacterium]
MPTRSRSRWAQASWWRCRWCEGAPVPAAAGDTAQTILHASAVGLEGRGVLILGASGAGKSSLALELMARGAALVADDRVWLTRRGTAVILTPPAAIAGRIEARGVGLLGAAWRPAELAVAVDLDRPEP